jgi:hypothetical protein
VIDFLHSLDDNNDGELSLDEFASGMDMLRLGIDRQQILALFAAVDVDGNGSISLQEMSRMIGAMPPAALIQAQGSGISTTATNPAEAQINIGGVIDVPPPPQNVNLTTTIGTNGRVRTHGHRGSVKMVRKEHRNSLLVYNDDGQIMEVPPPPLASNASNVTGNKNGNGRRK